MYQCEWSDAKYKKPTGILTNMGSFMQDTNFHIGWSTFDMSLMKNGDVKRKYLGPLPDQCSH